MGVDEIIVTWARTRGSTMKFFPVAAATASVICVMSASLKFGVIRHGPAVPKRSTQPRTSNGRAADKETKNNSLEIPPRAGAPALTAMYQVVPTVVVAAPDRARLRLGRPYPSSSCATCAMFQCQILLLPANA